MTRTGSGRVLDGKVAIVTGAAGGIGQAYARALGEAGARVVLADIDGGGAEEAAADLGHRGLEALGLEADVTSETSVRAMVHTAAGTFGGVDILVNNAALMAEISGGPALVEFPLEQWEQTLRVNLTGPLLCIRAVVPHMKQRGGGKIINQASGGAYLPGHAYGISKLALIGLTVHMASELGPAGITVNALAPGMIDTQAGGRARFPGMVEALAPSIPLRPLGRPEDLLGALLFLASPASDWVTGQVIGVDGGWIKRI